MKKITQNLYLPILNALLISSLSTLTACGSGGGDGNNSSVTDNGDSDSGVISPINGDDNNNGGNTGNDNGGNTGNDNGGNTGNDNGGNTGNDNGGNTGNDNGGNTGNDNGGNTGNDNNDNSGNDNNDNTGNDNNDNSGNDNSGDDNNDNTEDDDNNNEPDVIKDTVITLSVTEDGDMFSGKPYVFAYSIAAADGSTGANISPEFNIEAKYGVFTKTHPQTGRTAGDGKIFYYVPESVLGTTPDYYYVTEV
ncbi:hypothetical protein, partial [Ruminobacter sp.]|uniref:hypothetical protein n=1 Tax=Ruminobacter sp. TaxID=2774296 RepID=UPI00386C35A0